MGLEWFNKKKKQNNKLADSVQFPISLSEDSNP